MKLDEVKKELKKIKRTTFGISIPELRKFAKKLARGKYAEFIDEDDYSIFELKLLHAFLIGYIKADLSSI